MGALRHTGQDRSYCVARCLWNDGGGLRDATCESRQPTLTPLFCHPSGQNDEASHRLSDLAHALQQQPIQPLPKHSVSLYAYVTSFMWRCNLWTSIDPALPPSSSPEAFTTTESSHTTGLHLYARVRVCTLACMRGWTMVGHACRCIPLPDGLPVMDGST
jgi:hypothetical protein